MSIVLFGSQEPDFRWRVDAGQGPGERILSREYALCVDPAADPRVFRSYTVLIRDSFVSWDRSADLPRGRVNHIRPAMPLNPRSAMSRIYQKSIRIGGSTSRSPSFRQVCDSASSSHSLTPRSIRSTHTPFQETHSFFALCTRSTLRCSLHNQRPLFDVIYQINQQSCTQPKS
jgi:hypothetical protein